MSKNNFLSIIISAAALFFSSCKKETTANVSKIFTVPVIEITGDKVISLRVGSTYTDAGAKYTSEEGTVSDLPATSSTVNTAQPGLYTVKYSKTSTSGLYNTEAERIVVVTDVDNPKDYSGNYLRAATGQSAVVTKVARGVYRVQNPGGASGASNVVVHFAEVNLNTFVAPPQLTTVGAMSVIEIAFTDVGATWKVVNPGYGTGLRTFLKQ